MIERYGSCKQRGHHLNIASVYVDRLIKFARAIKHACHCCHSLSVCEGDRLVETGREGKHRYQRCDIAEIPSQRGIHTRAHEYTFQCGKYWLAGGGGQRLKIHTPSENIGRINAKPISPTDNLGQLRSVSLRIESKSRHVSNE